VVTLTTDFGLTDPYVGALKGIVLSRAPRATLVDLCHDLPPFDVRAASYLLGLTAPLFPPGTVHLAVVDPGVGTERPAVLVRTPGQFLVGPDNGCFDELIESRGVVGSWRITGSDRSICDTFHGRDLFAPLAGHLAAGHDLSRWIRPCPPPRSHRRAAARRVAGGLAGRVIWIDRFGNVVTSIRESDLKRHTTDAPIACEIANVTIDGIWRTYGEAPRGVPFMLWGSGGHLEVSIREGSAARRLGVRPGCSVRLAF
jgi:S-adenosylmethionine hydrolase